MESAPRRKQDRKRGHESASTQPEEPRGIDRGIADADKKVRTGSTDESVRNTPPAGAWNDTSSD